MWHDEDSPNLGSNDRNAISAWIIAVSLFFCLVAYSGIHGILS